MHFFTLKLIEQDVNLTWQLYLKNWMTSLKFVQIGKRLFCSRMEWVKNAFSRFVTKRSFLTRSCRMQFPNIYQPKHCCKIICKPVNSKKNIFSSIPKVVRIMHPHQEAEAGS